jgi:hypothetical protein
MISSGGGGGFPLPQSGIEWIGVIVAILLIVWVAKRWLD